jgi:quercetin dioxygenase-like cupin family protein
MLLRSGDRRLRLEGDLAIGLVAATEHLTAAVATLRPRGSGPVRAFGGDAVVHVTAGTVHAHVPDGDRTWFSIRTGDTFLVPAGVAFGLVNQGGERADMAIGSAPAWLPAAPA